jgi:hypothetical protein
MTRILLIFTDKKAYETAKASFGLQKSQPPEFKACFEGRAKTINDNPCDPCSIFIT